MLSTTFLALPACRSFPIVIVLLFEVLVEKLMLCGVKTSIALPTKVSLVQVVANDRRHRRFLANRFSVRPLPEHTWSACIAFFGVRRPSRHATLNRTATKRANLHFWHDEGVRILKVHRVLHELLVRPRVLRWHFALFAHSTDIAGSLGHLRLLVELAAVR